MAIQKVRTFNFIDLWTPSPFVQFRTFLRNPLPLSERTFNLSTCLNILISCLTQEVQSLQLPDTFENYNMFVQR